MVPRSPVGRVLFCLQDDGGEQHLLLSPEEERTWGTPRRNHRTLYQSVPTSPPFHSSSLFSSILPLSLTLIFLLLCPLSLIQSFSCTQKKPSPPCVCMSPGTLDHMRDAKPPSYRILLQTSASDFSYVVSVASSHQEITKDWQWLQENLLETLGGWSQGCGLDN